MTHLIEGMQAPEISSKDQNGDDFVLSDFLGKKIILYFYPKDDTPGCTKQACSLRDNYTTLTNLKFTIVGVSCDNQVSHQKFINKYDLPFTLLSDVEKKIVTDYGVWGKKKFMGRVYEGIHRMTFIIDEQGIIKKIFEKADTTKHAEQIIKEKWLYLE